MLALLILGSCSNQVDEDRNTVLMEKETRDYFLSQTMFSFRRDRPIAEDDPLLLRGVEEASKIPYHYGLVYSGINDTCNFREESGEWEGREPRPDSGLLIGGNASSGFNDRSIDKDSNDFAGILPYASLSVVGRAMSYNHGEIEYTFHSKDFNRNEFEAYDHVNVSSFGENTVITRYQQMTDDVQYSAVTGEPYLKNLSGVVYTGGIRKTVLDENGECTETCLENDDGEPLFLVRYKNAVIDQWGKTFDLVLSFTRITFVAEEDVSGPLSIMEGHKLFISPLIYQDGKFLVSFDDESQEEENRSQGIRIGARYEFDFSIEDEEGNPAEGLLPFAIKDLDEPSMASRLETGAQWIASGAENDYQWAEGIGLVDGAATFAVRPYYNHTLTDSDGRPLVDPLGDAELLHVSRMEGIPEDGTANGLMFSAANTKTVEEGGRNDKTSYDTGFCTLVKPRGSVVATMSADRRKSTEIQLFPSGIGNQVSQSATAGGSVLNRVYALENESDVYWADNRSNLFVVTGGDLDCVIKAKPGFSLSMISIDGTQVLANKLHWEEVEREDGTKVIQSKESFKGRHLIKDDENEIHIHFFEMGQAHSVQASFVPTLWYLPSRLGFIVIKRKTKLLLIALTFALVFVADVIWMSRKKTE